MVIRRDERITRLALGSAGAGGRLKSGDDAPQLIELLRLDMIDPDPDQPRRHFDEAELDGLADSLRQVGQLQPIIVVRQGERYRIHIGERRWRAAQRAGLATIRALVRASVPDARAARIAQIVENDQRADLTTSELVEAVGLLQADGLKGVEIAAALSRPKSRVSELAALSEAPPELAGLIDQLGLGLSYQLLRQWRAEPEATLDFLAQMPVEHISRVTIATIGGSVRPTIPDMAPSKAVAVPPVPAAPEIASVAPISSGRVTDGASPRDKTPPPRKPVAVAPGASAEPVSAPAIGTLLVEHEVHGRGQVLFGLDAAVDHLAVRFGEGAPLTLHKDAIRILAALPVDHDR